MEFNQIHKCTEMRWPQKYSPMFVFFLFLGTSAHYLKSCRCYTKFGHQNLLIVSSFPGSFTVYLSPGEQQSDALTTSHSYYMELARFGANMLVHYSKNVFTDRICQLGGFL